jgi:PAS domain S-box-containing protein
VNEILIDKLRLKFPPDLEEIYQEETFNNSLKQLRINILLVCIIYALFGIVDVIVTPEVSRQAWFIRYAVVVPAAFGVLAFSFSSRFRQYQQVIVSLLALLGGGGIVVLIDLTHGMAPYLHFAGLLLVFMTVYTAFKLRFLYAAAVGWTIIVMYEVSAIAITPPELKVFLTDNFFYISANLMGMFTNYQRELYSRREFLQVRSMQEIEQRKHALEKGLLNEAVDRAVRSLRESESRFRTLADTTSASIVIHRGKTLLYANPTVQRTTGYSDKELGRMEFWDIVHPDHRQMVRDRGRARLAGQHVPEEYEFKVITKNGEERWVSSTAGTIEYEGAPAIIATLFDITDRKHAEEEKVRLYEERIREEERHLREKENIIMELHDGVGGITTNISIIAELAQKSGDLDSVRKKLATISQLARDGVTEIRSFMRSIDTQGYTWHMLASEIRSLGSTLLEPHDIRFVLDAAVSDDHAAGGPGSLLCVNLYKIYKESLTNIVKHSKATAVAATLSIHGSGLRLTVEDNGIGCSRDIFAGRGLANIRRRAQELGGSAILSSDRGTRLELEIPLPLQPHKPGGSTEHGAQA